MSWTFQWRAGEEKSQCLEKEITISNVKENENTMFGQRNHNIQCLEKKVQRNHNVYNKLKFKHKSIIFSFVLTNGGYGEGLNLQIKKTRGLGQKSE